MKATLRQAMTLAFSSVFFLPAVFGQISGQNPLLLISKNNGPLGGVILGDTLGDIRFQGLIDGIGYRPGATIQSYVSGPNVGEHVQASLLFRTGTESPVMRMTIRENGNVGINTFRPQQLFTLSHATAPVFRFDRSDPGLTDYEIYTGANGTLFFRGGADAVGAALTDFMVLTAGGRLGLGTTTPQQLFTLSAPTAPVFRFERADVGEADYEVFLGNNGTLTFRGGADATGVTLPNRMALTGAGNLGLGTVTPERLLTLSSSAVSPTVRFERAGAGQNDLEMAVETNGDLYFRGGADGTALNDLMMLKSNGKLAIGTNQTPDDVGGTDISGYSLYAKGGILTEEVRVRVGWADYVFAPDYRLATLEEVEKHIKTQGHLPAAPSAKEVENNGLELGDCAVNQQAKIEELFLYVIELNKQVKALQEENLQLRKAIETNQH